MPKLPKDNTKEQKDWLMSYVKSSMYLDRLKKEGFSNIDAIKEQKARLSNLQNSNVHYMKSIANNPGFISGLYVPKRNEGYYRNWGDTEWKPNKYNPDTKKHIEKKGDIYLENEYRPGKIPYYGYETVPLHEYGHAVDEGGYRIPKSTVQKIKNYTTTTDRPTAKTKGLEFDYENTPSEYINRIQPIRYLLDKNKIYDARTQKFESKHYDQMIKNSNIKDNVHYQDVFNKLKGNETQKKAQFIDMMNTIADNNSNSDIFIAKNGGQYNNNMSKKNKNMKKLPMYKGGGQFWQDTKDFGGNLMKANADIALSMFGAEDAISDQDYKGKSGTAFSKTSGTMGSISKGILPTALAVGGGALAASAGLDPMMGAQLGMGLGKGVQGIGSAASPHNDPRGQRGTIQNNIETGDNIENSINAFGTAGMGVGKLIAPMMGQGANASMAGTARFGGVMKYPNGGMYNNTYTPTQIPMQGMQFNIPTMQGGYGSFQNQEDQLYSQANPGFKPTRKERKVIKSYGYDPNNMTVGQANVIEKQFANYNRPSMEHDEVGFGGSGGVGFSAPTAMFKMGGTNRFQGGGAYLNSQVELDENSLAPNGEFTQYNEPSHEAQNANTPNAALADGERVYSSKIKFMYNGKKDTAANHNKRYGKLIDSANKVLEDKNSSSAAKLTAKLNLLGAKPGADKVFNMQESTKDDKITKYIARLGGTAKFPYGGTKGNPRRIDRSAYQSEFDRFDANKIKNTESYISPEEFTSRYYNQNVLANMKNQGYTMNKDVDKYPVFIKDGSTLIRHPKSGSYVDIGDYKNVKFDIGNNTTPPVTNVTSATNATVSPTNKVYTINNNNTPSRLPYQTGPDYSFDPNTNQYFKGPEPTPENIIKMQSYNFRNGGVKRYDNGGIELGDDYDMGKTVRDQITDLRFKEAMDTSPYMKEYSDDELRNDFLSSARKSTTQVNNSGKYEADKEANKNQMFNTFGQLGMGVLQNMGNIYDIKRGSKIDKTTYERVPMQKLDSSEDLRRNLRLFKAAKLDARNASAGNASNYLANVNRANINKMYGDADVNTRYANLNAQLANQINMFNQQIGERETTANEMNQAQGRNLIGSGLTGIGQNVSGQMRDAKAGKLDEKTLALILKQYPNFKYTT